jgi:hypothetical protein
LTDLLFIPVALALYRALRRVNHDALLIGVSFVLLFAVLDLAVTWSNYGSLVGLTDRYAAAATDTQRANYVAAAEYASAALRFGLGVYSILVPSLGILLVALVMLRGVFGKPTAYVGVASGILGIVSVVGPFLVGALGSTIIVASLLTTTWVFLVGYRLYRLGQR